MHKTIRSRNLTHSSTQSSRSSSSPTPEAWVSGRVQSRRNVPSVDFDRRLVGRNGQAIGAMNQQACICCSNRGHSGWLIEVNSLCCDSVVEIMTGTIEQRLSAWYPNLPGCCDQEPSWKVKGKLDFCTTPGHAKSFLVQCTDELSSLLSFTRDNLSLVSSALLQRVSGSSSYCTHERLEYGDIVQVLVPSDVCSRRKFIQLSANGVGVHEYYTIGGIISNGSASIWLVVKLCSTSTACAQIPDYNKPLILEASIPPFYTESYLPFFFLELNNRVRKVGYIHNCRITNGCQFCTETMVVTHSTSTLGGGEFLILNRSSGYPPRRSWVTLLTYLLLLLLALRSISFVFVTALDNFNSIVSSIPLFPTTKFHYAQAKVLHYRNRWRHECPASFYFGQISYLSHTIPRNSSEKLLTLPS